MREELKIDDELILTLRDQAGESVYKEEKPIYLEVGESQFIRFSWAIPLDSQFGLYTFKAEFENADALPTLKSFEVS